VSIFEVLGMGLALGTFISMISSMVLAQTSADPFAWAIPAMVTIPVLWWLRRAGRLDWSKVDVPRREVWATALTLVVGAAAVIVNWPLVPLDAPTSKSFADLSFFEAISRGLAEFGPRQSILMQGGSLRYHWFTYAWSGELSQISHAEPFVVLTRVLPFVALLGVTLLAVSWAGRLSTVRWVPLLAGLLVVAGGYAGGLYGSILNFGSPSQSFTTMWLMAFGIAFLMAVRERRGLVLNLIIIVLLASAVTGGKISHALVAAGSAALLTAVLIARRDASWVRASIALCAAGVSMLLTYALVLSGVAVDRNLTEAVAVRASTWQGLDPFVGRLGIALGTLALLAAILARVTGMVWPRSGRHPIPVDWWFALGGLAVGAAALVLFREGVNELWFILAASAPASVVSARGVGAAYGWLSRESRVPRQMRWASFAAIPLAASIVCLVLSRNWTQHQQLLNWLAPISLYVLVPVASLLVAWRVFDRRYPWRACAVLITCALPMTAILTRPAVLWTSQRTITTESGAVSPVSVAGTPAASTPQPGSPSAANLYSAQRAAAEWIDSHTTADAVIATTDPVSAIVPALTGRETFIAGNLYQVGLGDEGDIETVRSRSAASVAFSDGPDSRALQLFCSAGGSVIWVAGTPALSWQGTADVVYANDLVSLLQLRPGFCTS